MKCSFLSWAYKVTFPHHNRDTQLCSQSHHMQIIQNNYNSSKYKKWKKMLFLKKARIGLYVPVLTTLWTRCTDIHSAAHADQYQFTLITLIHFFFFLCAPVRVLDCCLLMLGHIDGPSWAIKSSSLLWHWRVLCLVWLQGDFHVRCGVSKACFLLKSQVSWNPGSSLKTP